MYTQHFGLTGKPFRLSPDANFFFASKEHNRALAFLEYGIEQADGFIIITGDVGTGKTTILHTLLQDMDHDAIRCASVVSTQLDEDDLLELVASELGVDEETGRKGLLLKQIESALVADAQQGRRVILVIDEAQNLSPRSIEELRMLSNFQSEGQPLLQIFLVGQSELRATLLAPGFEQLRQRVIATYHLNPLDEAEARAYIEYRLGRVDWLGDPEFADDAFHEIFVATDGVPRRINNLCDRLLLYTYLEDLHHIDGRVVKAVSEEIGSEFSSGLKGQKPEPVEAEVPEAPERQEHRRVFDRPGRELESMARVMFDKANVQQRLGALERAIDSLGMTVKPELHEMREELSYMRSLLEDLVLEVRAQTSDPSRKRRA